MKIVTIVGARPQFIKLWALHQHLFSKHQHVIIHTGQHYDYVMSEIFLKELGLPLPDHHFEPAIGSHAMQVGQMLVPIETIIEQEKPDAIVVFGDTNTTLAGALAVAKLPYPLVHIEAGLRAYNRSMPEEINRIVTDHVSDLLFCSTETACNNLKKEGREQHVYWVGDLMFDTALHFSQDVRRAQNTLSQYGLKKSEYILATIHRAANTDCKNTLSNILAAFARVEESIIWPMHPRTKKVLESWDLKPSHNVHVITPLGYKDMLSMEKNARMILTDSGGIQKEAFFFGVPCLTLRQETEWTELVAIGWNKLVGDQVDEIIYHVRTWQPEGLRPNLYGDGDSGAKIVTILENHFGV